MKHNNSLLHVVVIGGITIIFDFLGFSLQIKYFESRANYIAAFLTASLILIFFYFYKKRSNSVFKQKYSYYDELTGLPNRAHLKDRLSFMIQQANDINARFSILFLDLDRFKNVNDSLGHEFGDRILVEVSKRLSLIISENNLFRMGGDEFVILFSEFESENEIAKFAKEIIDAFNEPLIIGEHEIFTTASIGISVFPNDGQAIDEIIKNADSAMYSVKERGKNSFQFYSSHMNDKAFENLKLESSMRKAIEKQEFYLVYQPIFETGTRRIKAVEALIRWKHPIEGNISPAKFIPLAEETGLIIPIGEWVLKNAVRQCKEWHDKGYKIMIAVNISAKQLYQDNFYEIIHSILNETKFDPKFLELEITENSLLKETEKTLETLKKIKSLGVSLSIDDFGTGFSSLSYLKKFEVDLLKIDQSFVRDLYNDNNDRIITETILNMAHTLDLKVVAEGVETEEQRNFLAIRNCEYLQGYLFSKPLLPEEIEKMLI